MAKRVQVRLVWNWEQIANPEGPATFIRADTDEPGVLQVSLYAEYKSGKTPNPTARDLIELACGHGERHAVGELVETSSGVCDLGTFGSAVFQSEEYAREQFWYLSNGWDFVLATLICTTEPDPDEVAEAQQIVQMLTLSE